MVDGFGIGVAAATGCFEVGSRTDSRDTFFCLAKRKYPKKRPPHRRLLPALLGFERGCLKGLPSPCMQRAASMRRPLTGYSVQTLRCSARQRGLNPSLDLKRTGSLKKEILVPTRRGNQEWPRCGTKFTAGAELPHSHAARGNERKRGCSCSNAEQQPMVGKVAHPKQIWATDGFNPVCRAEHRSFYRELPEGVRQGCRTAAEGLGSPFCRPSIKTSARRLQAASGPPFFWILFFGGAKKSVSAVGPRTDIK
ncbi:hypothetical protein EDE11_105222 [Methylomonas methanica]|uniref:Uncharacterized protein n=1 Tax=Methylomonas methanica TaxID=421 RepID=A0ABY2CPK3_METMH|nr:hypothetical protein EDE11_105222 [Methylomonas methanica]